MRKDPAHLTPYEEKLLKLKQSGMTYKQISTAYECKERTISARFQIIRDKLRIRDANGILEQDKQS
jgi:DNA-binding CsgD family transcriptional regulator